MQKREASITPRINKWFARVCPQSSPWEIKHTRGLKIFRFGEIREHQLQYLYAATTPNGFTYKIPDLGFSYPPCDVIHYKNTPAYIIIAFPEMAVAIEIRKVLEYMKESKSIPFHKALMIADYATEISKLPA